MHDLVLPAFEMDCRDWVVLHAGTPGLPDDVGGAPLVAVLSTVLIDGDQFCEASGVLTVGLLDEDTVDAVDTHPLDAGPSHVAVEVIEGEDGESDLLRYLVPAPHGQIALLAEFRIGSMAVLELQTRIERLLTSFRWVGVAA